MKTHTVKALLAALESRPVIMRPPVVVRGLVREVEAKHGVTLAPRKKESV